jgi:hypothetical protein
VEDPAQLGEHPAQGVDVVLGSGLQPVLPVFPHRTTPAAAPPAVRARMATGQDVPSGLRAGLGTITAGLGPGVMLAVGISADPVAGAVVA